MLGDNIIYDLHNHFIIVLMYFIFMLQIVNNILRNETKMNRIKQIIQS